MVCREAEKYTARGVGGQRLGGRRMGIYGQVSSKLGAEREVICTSEHVTPLACITSIHFTDPARPAVPARFTL